MKPFRKLHSSRFQYGLRGLLGLVVALGIVLSWIASRIAEKRQERALVADIEEQGGIVQYDWQVAGKNTWPGPGFLKDLCGRDCCADVVHIRAAAASKLDFSRFGALHSIRTLSLAGADVTDEGLCYVGRLDTLVTLNLTDTTVTDKGLSCLKGLRSVHHLLLKGTGVSDAGMATLAELPLLETLTVDATNVSDRGLSYLEGSALKTLSLDNTKVTDRGVVCAKRLSHLEQLYLNETQITDAGVMQLCDSVSLKVLELDRTAVTDKCLSYLKAMRSLERLSICDTLVTIDGGADFEDAMPECNVYW
jgi:hypothetical protein